MPANLAHSQINYFPFVIAAVPKRMYLINISSGITFHRWVKYILITMTIMHTGQTKYSVQLLKADTKIAGPATYLTAYALLPYVPKKAVPVNGNSFYLAGIRVKYHTVFFPFIYCCISFFVSRSFKVSRLSCTFFPLPKPISSFAQPLSLKKILRGIML